MKAEFLNKSIRICNLLGNSVNEQPEREYVADEFSVRFAEYHKLTALFASALDYYGLDGGEYAKIRALADREIVKQLKRDVLQDKICKSFSEKGIAHAVLKGTQTRRFYPDYLTRTSNDIDIYVGDEDIVAASALLKALGSESVEVQNSDFVFGYQCGYVELHTAMGGFTNRQKRYFDRLVSGFGVDSDHSLVMRDEDRYIHAVFHLYTHFIIAGAGVRMFLDVYCIDKNAELDRKYIESALEKLSIKRFEDMVSKINGVLFEGKEATSEILEILGYVFANGAYGSDEAAKHLKYSASEAIEQKNSKNITYDLCLDLDSMKKRYDVLNSAVDLYPFCVVHRVIKGVVFRKRIFKKAVNSAKDILVKRDYYSRILKISGIL